MVVMPGSNRALSALPAYQAKTPRVRNRSIRVVNIFGNLHLISQLINTHIDPDRVLA